jgi:DNA-binding transcriptional LysR family regulator
MRLGTLSAAAETLCQTQPTIGRHIRDLETAVGEPLFTRRGSLITPTPRAAALYERAAAMEMAAYAVERDIAGSNGAAMAIEQGTVRLSVPEVLGSHVIPGIIADFQALHPGIAIELAATNATDDLMRREADIAVRLYRPRQPDLVMTKAGAVHVGLYATPDYLASHPPIESLADFARHRMIGEDQGDRLIKAMLAFGLPVTRDSFIYRADSILAQIAATEAGVGLGAGLTMAFDKAKVVRVLAEQVNITFDVYVVAHNDLYRSRRMRLMHDALVDGLRSRLNA